MVLFESIQKKKIHLRYFYVFPQLLFENEDIIILFDYSFVLINLVFLIINE